jgi:uncharacterized protein YlbG (UPF0298 family)
MSPDDRRYLCLDVSNKNVKNYEYFDKLASYTENEDVARAFYIYCHENYDKKFNLRKLPSTETKKDIIVDNLNNVLVFIKENYVLTGKTLEGITFQSFFDEYTSWSTYTNKRTKYSKVYISKLLKDEHITTCMKHGNIKTFNMSYDELKDLYTTNKWIHETDEFVSQASKETDKKIENDKKSIVIPIEDNMRRYAAFSETLMKEKYDTANYDDIQTQLKALNKYRNFLYKQLNDKWSIDFITPETNEDVSAPSSQGKLAANDKIVSDIVNKATSTAIIEKADNKEIDDFLNSL